MKRILLISILAILGNVINAKEYKQIQIGITTTVHLIFNTEILSYDIGLGDTGEFQDILASQVGNNRLKLGAGVEHFEKTNLFVETQRAYYNFILVYEEFPQNLMYFIQEEDAQQIKVDSEGAALPIGKEKEYKNNKEDNQYMTLCAKVLEKAEQSFLYANSTLGVGFQLDNIYIEGDKLLFKFTVYNNANVKYEVGYLGYMVSSKGSGKKQGVATDETIQPLYSYQTFTNLEAGESKKIVSVFSKFTLEKKKQLIINLWENKGERMVEIKATPKQIVNAEILK